jgi:tricarballylate dehydrogenase
MKNSFDVVVVGTGNAALSAALSASDNGAKKILVIEKASKKERGGNSRYTNGAFRFAYNGYSDLKKIIPTLKNSNSIDYGKYTVSDFLKDMEKVTNGKTDKSLSKILTGDSFDTVHWLSKKGLKFTPIEGRQSFVVEGKMKYWGGLTLEVKGQGETLVDSLLKIVAKHKITIQYDTAAVDLIYDKNTVMGLEVLHKNKIEKIYSKSVVLACGGFESNPEMRTRYLGPGWDMAKVRGTKHNTGDGLNMAFKVGASAYGNWSGCHAVFHDLNGPEYSDLKISNKYRKISYPWGIVLNADGERFVDEGEDFRNYTYAKFGKEVIKQPNQLAWQIFDQKVRPMLYSEYDVKSATMVKANTLEELVKKLTGVNSQKALDTIHEYNNSVNEDVNFDPTIKDGKCTTGLKVNKTNWANKIDTAPFYAYGVTCGITFTFGGLRINNKGQVLNKVMKPIKGLYAAGEMVGGIFYFNYPGGSGLTSGAVFGRLAGKSAAKH